MAAGDGLVTMTPTSIAHSGTSAVINANGGVDFTAVTSLSLNGVFTSAHDNYFVTFYLDVAAGIPSWNLKLRAGGTDTTGSNYVRQIADLYGTTESGVRSTGLSDLTVTVPDDISTNGGFLVVYKPFVAQPTTFRSSTIYSFSDVAMYEMVGTHSLSTSYDGFTLATTSSNVTGNIHVFGFEE